MTADPTPYWGPHFPDWWGNSTSIPAIAASLSLASPLTSSGKLDGLTIRARTAGPGGNSITFAMTQVSGAPLGGHVVEVGNAVSYQYPPTGSFFSPITTVSNMVSAINVGSTLVEIVGTFNPADRVTDEFTATALTGGTSAINGLATYWGGHFPDRVDIETPPLIEPVGPQAAATFALQIENGLRVTLSWSTSLFKSYTGLERRAGLLDDPKQTYAGRALLLGDAVRQVRSSLARYAALGRPFLIGLPFEETTLSADATGAVCPVADAVSGLDWAVKGQRVVCIKGDGISVEGVVQDATGNSVTLNSEAAGAVLVEGARLMPAMATLFEPQQGFSRKRPATGVEYWQISGRAALFGFPSAAVPGEINLIGELSGIRLRTKAKGVDATITIASDTTGALTAEVSENPDGSLDVFVNFADGVATVQQFVDAVAATGYFWVFGSYTGTTVMTDASQLFSEPFVGAEAAAPGIMGRGATVTTFDDRPVWDRGIVNPDSVGDSMHSLSELVDLGGIPFGVGATDTPDWGRQVAIVDDRRSEWQWLKAFLAAVYGRWKTFLLPTGREDLESVADATSTTLTVDTAIGEVALWDMQGHDVLRVEQAGGIRYVKLLTSFDNNDGTTTLTVTGDTLDAAAVTSLQWCELCRFESDDFEILFGADGFQMTAKARVIQPHLDNSGLVSWFGDESSTEDSAPREGIEIQHGATTYRIATGSRDITIGGNLYTASPAAREEIGVSFVSGPRDLTLKLPTSHAFVQRYLAITPPQSIAVNVWHKQLRSGEEERVWRGTIAGCSVENHVATFRAPSLLAMQIERKIPTIAEGRQCAYILYDENCRAQRTGANMVVSSVASHDGNTVTLTTDDGMADLVAAGGELLHVASGERMTIKSKSGLVLTLQLPLVELADTDTVHMFRGCAHDINTCDADFDNVDNYNGSPHRPDGDIFLRSGLGIIESE